MLLVVLEHGVVRRLLAVDDDVDDRVQAGWAGQRGTELALANHERLVDLAVDDAGNQAFAA